MFTFGTVVKVIAGFYIGCTGIVTQTMPTGRNSYVVNLDCRDGNNKWHSITTEILIKDLEKK